MTETFTTDQAIAIVPGLSQARLAAFLDANLIEPSFSSSGLTFRPIDLARLQLLCDLEDQFDLESDALGVVIALIDQLHAARHDLHAIALAISEEPQDLRRRVGARLIGTLIY